MQTFLNGSEFLRAGDLEIRVDLVDQHHFNAATISVSCRGEANWAVTFDGPAPDPAFTDVSGVRSYAAIAWPEAGFLVLAGDSSVVLLDLITGAVVDRFALEFTPVGTILQTLLFEEPPLVVVASTKRIVLIDQYGFGEWFEPVGPVSEIIGVSRDQLLVREYDLDDALLPIVETSYDIPTNLGHPTTRTRR